MSAEQATATQMAAADNAAAVQQQVAMQQQAQAQQGAGRADEAQGTDNNLFASLYVGNLSPAVTESVLFEAFNNVAPVLSIRICRDSVSRQSLGYGYVNFHSHKDAAEALEQLNFELLMGKPMRVMWSQRDPSKRRSGVGNIFIKNLHPDIDEKALHDTFSQFGTIYSVKIVRDDKGISRGFGFVHFNDPQNARKAIDAVNGKVLQDQQVYVAPFKSRRERMAEIEAQEKNFTNVYVKNLPKEYTEDDLRQLFSTFGQITSLKIMTQEMDGRLESRGFGFVSFKETDAAKRAVQEMHEKEIGDKKLYVARAQKKSERLRHLRSTYNQRRMQQRQRFQGANVYVRNLDADTDDDQLRELFQDLGQITSVRVMKDESGVSRGFGFVCFSSPEEAANAISKMMGYPHNGRPLYVALSQTKEERRAVLAERMKQFTDMRMRMPMYYVSPMQAMPPRPFMGQRPRMPFMSPAGPQTRPRGRPGMRPMMRGPAGAGMMPARPPMRPGAPAPGSMPSAVRLPPPPTRDQLEGKAAPEQKRIIGEYIFLRLQHAYGERTGKITGMLLEMEPNALLPMISDDAALQSRADEAVRVLQAQA